MVKLSKGGAYLINGTEIIEDSQTALAQVAAKTGSNITSEEAAKNTIAYGILKSHNTSDNMDKLKIKFDKMTSHDITFVGIIQTARASGLEKFPIPYVLTNCHNSLCAVGGTINEDDHMFGLTCAKKYGGIYVPPHQAVIHQFSREMLAEGGKMILGSDSHTRYGALGTMAMGEGGGADSAALSVGISEALINTAFGNFQDGSCPGKIQFGSGWWFNDQLDGMTKQMNALSVLGLLSRFVGPYALASVEKLY